MESIEDSDSKLHFEQVLITAGTYRTYERISQTVQELLRIKFSCRPIEMENKNESTSVGINMN